MANEKELEQIIAENPAPASPEQDPEIKKREEHKANLDKAIVEAEGILQEKRRAIKQPTVEDDLPKIDLNDPSAQAWDRRIKESNAPISSQLEAQKSEVRQFALRKFLADRPSLSRNPDKLKELMANYDRIKVATEQTQEGVLLDLEKSYAVTFHEELISAARNGRVDQAKEDMIASDIAVSRGSTSESNVPPAKRKLSAEEQKIVEQWETHGAPKID